MPLQMTLVTGPTTHWILPLGSRAGYQPRAGCNCFALHGSCDTLIDPSGGRRTAELIPGATYVEFEGMGHDYPPAVWDRWVATWASFVRDF